MQKGFPKRRTLPVKQRKSGQVNRSRETPTEYGNTNGLGYKVMQEPQPLGRAPRRLYLTWIDRALFVWLYRGFPRILDAITILRPETIVRWHRKGFAAFWRWKSRPLGGRPQIDKEVRDLIRRMSFENPTMLLSIVGALGGAISVKDGTPRKVLRIGRAGNENNCHR
jgi:hypothetical protein